MKILQDTLREEFGKRTIAETELPNISQHRSTR